MGFRHFFKKLFRGSFGEAPDTYGIPTTNIVTVLGRSSDSTTVQSKVALNIECHSPVPAGAVNATSIPSIKGFQETPEVYPSLTTGRYPASEASNAVPQRSGILPVPSFKSMTTNQSHKQLPAVTVQETPEFGERLPTISVLGAGVIPPVRTLEPTEPGTLDTPIRSPMYGNQVVASPSLHNSGILASAQGVIINNSTMTEVHQHHGPNALERMVPYVIPGAEFDSSNRDDPPRCHPDTRASFLEQLQAHIHDTTLGTRVIWLFGPAGIGKSAIVQSLAEVVCPLPTLRCATLFLSRPNHRDDPKKVFTTLAYSLAVADPEYHHYIETKMAGNPGFLDRSLDEQFKRLFVAPFTSGCISVGSRRWVMFLDGFDEINGERDQCRILDLIRNSLPPTPICPFIWIIASRPEAHLQSSFGRVKEQVIGFWQLEVPMDSEDALRGVELYLRTEFTKIRRDYSDIVPLLWPSENDFLRLTKASSGLFIFASTLIDYVGKENPVLRLRHIVSLIGRNTTGQQGSPHQTHPFHTLDILYSTIMANVSPVTLPTTKTILGFYLLGDIVSEETPSLFFLCNVLGLEQHEAYAALRKLHSVLSLPLPDKAQWQPVRFLHASFSDFLKDHSRSQSYYIDLDEELLKIWQCYGNILKLSPVAALNNYIPLSWEPPPSTDGNILRNLIQSQARKFWFTILTCFSHDPSCPSQCKKVPYRLLPNITEVIEVLEEFGIELYEKHHDFKALCDWFPNHAPATLRQRIIFKNYDLMELSERDLDNMFGGLYLGKPAFYYLYWGSTWFPQRFDLEDLGIDQWSQAKRLALDKGESVSWREDPLHWSVLANLLILRKRNKDSIESRVAKVIILRTSSTRGYAIIGPLFMAISRSINLEYLVFPYVEEGE